jgi:hypothetical protein
MASGPLVLPLVETIDRTGDSFNKGLGNAPVSSTAAAIQGAVRGLDQGTLIADRILTTRRENDPARLEAEQLNRDLKNQQLQEVVRNSQITNQIAAETADTQVAQAEATLDATRTRTDIARRQNTEERLQLQDAGIRARIAATSSNIATQAENRRVSRLENTPEMAAERLRRARFDNDFLEEKLAAPFQASQSGLDPDTARKMQKDFFDTKLKINEQRAKLQDNLRLSPENKKALEDNLAQLETQLNELNNGAFKYDLNNTSAEAQRVSSEIQRENARIDNELRRTSTRARRRRVVEEASAAINENYRDGIEDPTGTPNYAGIIANMGSVAGAIAQEDTPDIKRSYEGLLAESLRRGGGTEAFLDYINNDVKDPQEQQFLKENLTRAILRSGQLDLLLPEQRNLQEAGYSEKNIASPDRTTDETIKLIQGGVTAIKDPNIRNASTSNNFLVGIQKVSRRGTQPVEIIPEGAEARGGDTETGAGQPSGVLKYRVVNTETGEDFPVEITGNATSLAELNVASDIAQELNSRIQAQGQAQARQQTIQTNNAQGIVDPAAPSAPAQPAQQPQSPAQNFVAKEASDFFVSSLSTKNPTPELLELGQRLGAQLGDGQLDTGLLSGTEERGLVDAAVNSLAESMTQDLLAEEGAESLDDLANIFRGSAAFMQDRIKNLAREEVQRTVGDTINMTRLQNTLRRQELVVQAQGLQGVDKMKAELRLEQFDRGNNTTITPDQARAIQDLEQQMLAQARALREGREPSMQAKQQIRLESMRRVLPTFGSTIPVTRDIDFGI